MAVRYSDAGDVDGSVAMKRLGNGANYKIETFLTRLAISGMSGSTQNQAFNALVFFYKEALAQPLGDVSALRAIRLSKPF